MLNHLYFTDTGYISHTVLFIRLFNKYLLRDYEPDTILDTEYTTMNKTRSLQPWSLYQNGVERDIKIQE